MSKNTVSKKERLVKLHKHLKGLTNRRSFPNDIVTADDAEKYLDTLGVSRDVRTRLSLINSVLRSPNFTAVGERYSTRSKAKRRAITEWARSY